MIKCCSKNSKESPNKKRGGFRVTTRVTIPIGSMSMNGIYLPTWVAVFFFVFILGKYTSPMDPSWALVTLPTKRTLKKQLFRRRVGFSKTRPRESLPWNEASEFTPGNGWERKTVSSWETRQNSWVLWSRLVIHLSFSQVSKQTFSRFSGTKSRFAVPIFSSSHSKLATTLSTEVSGWESAAASWIPPLKLSGESGMILTSVP